MVIRELSKDIRNELAYQIQWKPVYLHKSRHENKWYKMRVKWWQGQMFLGFLVRNGKPMRVLSRECHHLLWKKIFFHEYFVSTYLFCTISPSLPYFPNPELFLSMMKILSSFNSLSLHVCFGFLTSSGLILFTSLDPRIILHSNCDLTNVNKGRLSVDLGNMWILLVLAFA